MAKIDDGTVYYVDFESINKQGGHSYFWALSDSPEACMHGHLSGKTHKKVDCMLMRYQDLSFKNYKQSMGLGSEDRQNSYSPKNQEWEYPRPNSSSEAILKAVCNEM
ncbi:MAG: surface-adhesin E family protein [Porticoccus sp.]